VLVGQLVEVELAQYTQPAALLATVLVDRPSKLSYKVAATFIVVKMGYMLVGFPRPLLVVKAVLLPILMKLAQPQ
jgi:hypothetical protein